MATAQVVIVGRPNVGKSSILNWLVGKRLAIVDDMAGVTRDRMMHEMEHEGRRFVLVDTGGIGINDVDDLSHEIEQQIEYALAAADLVMFVVDARAGLVPLDQQVAQRLRSLKKPVLVVANKVDSTKLEPQADEFYRLGADEVLRVSTLQNRNRTALLDAIVKRLPEATSEPEPEPVMKMAIVGRRNVGKSTFINTLVNSPRMIVSEVPGTTRDSVDVKFDLDGKPFIAIDTPGVRSARASVATSNSTDCTALNAASAGPTSC